MSRGDTGRDDEEDALSPSVSSPLRVHAPGPGISAKGVGASAAAFGSSRPEKSSSTGLSDLLSSFSKDKAVASRDLDSKYKEAGYENVAGTPAGPGKMQYGDGANLDIEVTQDNKGMYQIESNGKGPALVAINLEKDGKKTDQKLVVSYNEQGKIDSIIPSEGLDLDKGLTKEGHKLPFEKGVLEKMLAEAKGTQQAAGKAVSAPQAGQSAPAKASPSRFRAGMTTVGSALGRAASAAVNAVLPKSKGVSTAQSPASPDPAAPSQAASSPAPAKASPGRFRAGMTTVGSALGRAASAAVNAVLPKSKGVSTAQSPASPDPAATKADKKGITTLWAKSPAAVSPASPDPTSPTEMVHPSPASPSPSATKAPQKAETVEWATGKASPAEMVHPFPASPSERANASAAPPLSDRRSRVDSISAAANAHVQETSVVNPLNAVAPEQVRVRTEELSSSRSAVHHSAVAASPPPEAKASPSRSAAADALVAGMRNPLESRKMPFRPQPPRVFQQQQKQSGRGGP